MPSSIRNCTFCIKYLTLKQAFLRAVVRLPTLVAVEDDMCML